MSSRGSCSASRTSRRASAGRKAGLWPFGWFWLLREFKRTRWINPQRRRHPGAYRGLGVNAILYVEMQKTIHDGGFDHADLVQMEEHVLTVADTETMGGRITSGTASIRRT